jgi:hypothetical protein
MRQRLSDHGVTAAPDLPDPYANKSGLARDLCVLWDMVAGSWINLLLFAIPFGFASEYMGWGPVATFSLVRACRGKGTEQAAQLTMACAA